MGIDYSAKFGIGYEIHEPELDDDAYFDDFLDDLPLEENGLKYFQFGGEYEDDGFKWCLVFNEPLDSSFNFDSKKKLLDDFLAEHGIESSSPFGLVGGLYVC